MNLKSPYMTILPQSWGMISKWFKIEKALLNFLQLLCAYYYDVIISIPFSGVLFSLATSKFYYTPGFDLWQVSSPAFDVASSPMMRLMEGQERQLQAKGIKLKCNLVYFPQQCHINCSTWGKRAGPICHQLICARE